MPRWCCVLMLLALVLLSGCQKEEPLPPTAPPPEDLSTWMVPELVQPERPLPELVKPVKLPAGTSEKVYDYKPGVAVEVPVAIGFPLDIVLEPGEQVRQIVDGDRGPAEQGQARRWEVHEGGDGTGDTLRPHVFVTASAPGLTNGITITTTRRMYYITCKSVNRSPTRVLRWHYPENGPGATPVPVAQHPPGSCPPRTSPSSITRAISSRSPSRPQPGCRVMWSMTARSSTSSIPK
jgi:hypothetical protein